MGNLLSQYPTLQKSPILRVSEDVSVGLSLKRQQTQSNSHSLGEDVASRRPICVGYFKRTAVRFGLYRMYSIFIPSGAFGPGAFDV